MAVLAGGRAEEVVLNVCFHGIGVPGRPLEPGEGKFWVGAAQFEDLLGVIGRYPWVRVMFDDGNASDAEIAFPALRRHGLTATFFVIADRIGQPGSVSPADVKMLAAGGMRIGSHGKAHRSWRAVDDRELGEELTGAAGLIGAVCGLPVRELACPFGFYDRRVLGAIRRCGFERVFTSDGGPARAGAWLQARYTVKAGDTPASLERLCRSPRGGRLESAVRAGKGLVKRWR